MEESNEINFILVLPYTDKRVKYKLNSNTETYTKPIEDFFRFSSPYISMANRSIVRELLWSFTTFLIDIYNDKVIELSEDRELKEVQKVKVIQKKRESDLDKGIKQTIRNTNSKTLSYKSNVNQFWKK